MSLKLYGAAKWFEQVGKAQIELMDAWLDPTIVGRAGDQNVLRGENRNAGIYRDFYDLTFIVNSPEPLDSILRGFHAGTIFLVVDKFQARFARRKRKPFILTQKRICQKLKQEISSNKFGLPAPVFHSPSECSSQPLFCFFRTTAHGLGGFCENGLGLVSSAGSLHHGICSPCVSSAYLTSVL